MSELSVEVHQLSSSTCLLARMTLQFVMENQDTYEKEKGVFIHIYFGPQYKVGISQARWGLWNYGSIPGILVARHKFPKGKVEESSLRDSEELTNKRHKEVDVQDSQKKQHCPLALKLRPDSTHFSYEWHLQAKRIPNRPRSC